MSDHTNDVDPTAYRDPDSVSRDAARHGFRRLSLWNLANTLKTQQAANNSAVQNYQNEHGIEGIDVDMVPFGSTTYVVNNPEPKSTSATTVGKVVLAGLLGLGGGIGIAEYMKTLQPPAVETPAEVIPIDATLEWGPNNG